MREFFEVSLKDGDVVKINGVSFVKIKNNLIKVSVEGGIPVIKEVTSEEIRHSNGRIDCTIKVPCLSLSEEVIEPK